MLDKYYRLQDTVDVYISELSDDRVLLTFHRMTTREKKEMACSKIIAEFLASLSGQHSARDILQKLGTFKETDASKLLNFLLSEHLIYETNEENPSEQFDPEDLKRYSRQIAYFDDMVFSHRGTTSQNLLQQNHIVIIGCGAVTGAMAEILARAGVQKFTLIDDKKVHFSTKVRHTFFRSGALGDFKAKVLASYLKRINSNVKVNTFCDRLLPHSDLSKWIEQDVSLVINGCDEPYIGYTSLKIGRFLQQNNIPMYVMGGFDAHLMSSGELIYPPKTPCIDCCQQTFQNALKDWKPFYNNNPTYDDKALPLNKPDFTNNQNGNFSPATNNSTPSATVSQSTTNTDIGGAGGLSAMSLFSANLSCIRIIHFLIGDQLFDYTTERHEYLINQGSLTSFEMTKQTGCKICNG